MKNVLIICLSVVLVLLTGPCFKVKAQETNSFVSSSSLFSFNSSGISQINEQRKTHPITIEQPINSLDSSFIERYELELKQKSDYNLKQFYPLRRSIWIRRLGDGDRSEYERVNSLGKSIVRNLLLDSAREALVENLPRDEWETIAERRLDGFGKFFIRLIIGSVANTVQERDEIISPNPTPISLANLDPENTYSSRDYYRYTPGVRLDRLDPYFYVQSKFGQELDKQPIIRNEVRLGFDANPGRIGIVKISERIIIPTTPSSQIVLGGYYQVETLNSNRQKVRSSIRFEKKFTRSIGALSITRIETGEPSIAVIYNLPL